LWYPKFNLKENPFDFTDRATEKEYNKDFGLIDTKGAVKVLSMIRANTSAIFEGPKGCGKSTALELVALSLWGDDKISFAVIGPRSFPLLYESLRNELLEMLGEKVYSELSASVAHTYRKELKRWCYRHTVRKGETETYCNYIECQKRKRCILWEGGNPPKFEEIIKALPLTFDCSLKRWTTLRLYEHMEKKGLPFLLDVPDDLVETGAKYLSRFLVELRKASRGIIILMATREQYQKLKKTEAFARYLRRDFPLLDKEELVKICEGRLKKVTEGEFKMPFDEDSLNYLCESSGRNPREFLRRCGIVLQNMTDVNRKSPSTLNFVLNVLGSEANLSELDAFEATVRDFLTVEGEYKPVWVKVKLLVAHLKDRYNLEIKDSRVGWLCKNKKFDHKYSPDSEWRLR